MGTQKVIKNSDGTIVFHVGKELPEKGGDFLLVPGVQNAQGRGIYCSSMPLLRYAGGEHFQKQMEVIPIFCIPAFGVWHKSIPKKKKHSKEMVYRAADQVIALQDLSFDEIESVDGGMLRYYYPRSVSFFVEPEYRTESGTRIHGKFSDDVRGGHLPYEEALAQLRKSGTENYFDEVVVGEKIINCMDAHLIPENTGIRREYEAMREAAREQTSEMVSEVHAQKKSEWKLKMR